jgi:hypothetical protein
MEMDTFGQVNENDNMLYKRVAYLDPNGKFKIGGQRYTVDWVNHPEPREIGLMAKMGRETHELVKECISNGQPYPLMIVSSALKGIDLVHTRIQKRPALERINKAGVYLYSLELCDKEEGIYIGEKFYTPEFIIRPTIVNRDLVKKIIGESVDVGNEFFKEKNKQPTTITSSANEEMGLVYSQAS